MSKTVLDSSAVLAVLHREKGGEHVLPFLTEGTISTVNVAEVLGKLIDGGISNVAATADLGQLRLEIIPFTEELAVLTAALRQSTRHAGLSLGDRACLAAAKMLGIPAVTADRTWSKLKLDIPIQVVR